MAGRPSKATFARNRSWIVQSGYPVTLVIVDAAESMALAWNRARSRHLSTGSSSPRTISSGENPRQGFSATRQPNSVVAAAAAPRVLLRLSYASLIHSDADENRKS